MYPFSVKFKINVEKTSPEMTVDNLTDYFKDKLKSENVEITSETNGIMKRGENPHYCYRGIVTGHSRKDFPINIYLAAK